MPRKTHTNFMRATIWTPTMRTDVGGTPAVVIETAFGALAGRPRARAALLKALTERAERFAEWEAKNPDGLIEKDTTK